MTDGKKLYLFKGIFAALLPQNRKYTQRERKIFTRTTVVGKAGLKLVTFQNEKNPRS